MSREHQASELRDLDDALADLEEAETTLPILLRRLSRHCGLVRPGAKVLDVGAAQGILMTVLGRLGYDVKGVEPFGPAIETSKRLADRTGIPLRITQGVGEDLPFGDEEFDLVIADSVMEHVDDPIQMFREAYRVLMPGGGLYFYSTSGLAWNQAEIKYFPLFPWYPDRVRRRIMHWAVENRPSWVGHTPRPAIHWFTPRRVRRDLDEVGFTRVIDRWHLKGEDELEGWRRSALRIGRGSAPLRFAGEVVRAGSGFLAIK